jgi:hypothetical protein
LNHAHSFEGDHARIPNVLTALARELLEMDAKGDRVRIEAWSRSIAVCQSS